MITKLKNFKSYFDTPVGEEMAAVTILTGKHSVFRYLSNVEGRDKKTEAVLSKDNYIMDCI